MYYVYVLKSLKHAEKMYVGYTAEINQRLWLHNDGKSIYTAKYRPWSLFWYCVFQDEHKAIEFEKYLKTGSGKALIAKHLI